MCKEATEGNYLQKIKLFIDIVKTLTETSRKEMSKIKSEPS